MSTPSSGAGVIKPPSFFLGTPIVIQQNQPTVLPATITPAQAIPTTSLLPTLILQTCPHARVTLPSPFSVWTSLSVATPRGSAHVASPADQLCPASVPAQDRLFLWKSEWCPEGDSAADLPEELVILAQSTIARGLALNTKKTYTAAIWRWIEFCDEWEIPERH
jgi:hypothetical protein